MTIIKPSKYTKILQSLLEYPREQEWFEFKANWFEPNALGEYISALANAAAYHGHDYGYFVWGIEDKTHAIVGTDFDQTQEVKREPLTHYLERQLTPDTAFAFHELEMDGKRIVLLEIAAAKTVPTAFANVRYFRMGTSLDVRPEYIDVLGHLGGKLVVMQFDSWIYGKRPYTFHGCPYWKVG